MALSFGGHPDLLPFDLLRDSIYFNSNEDHRIIELNWSLEMTEYRSHAHPHLIAKLLPSESESEPVQILGFSEPTLLC